MDPWGPHFGDNFEGFHDYLGSFDFLIFKNDHLTLYNIILEGRLDRVTFRFQISNIIV